MAEIFDASGYTVEQIAIVTKDGRVFDIFPLIEELNIFDSIFMPTMSGNMLVTDSVGLSDAVKFDGSEVLLLSIGKFDWFKQGNFKKQFRIYSQTDRIKAGLNADKYLLHFVSEEFILSKQDKVYDGKEATYSSFAETIVKKYLNVKDEFYLSEPSSGVRNINAPGLTPLQTAQWCAKRALDINGSPNYLFFANKLGYNFSSLSTLLQREKILHISVSPKNLQDNSEVEEMFSAKGFQVVSQSDAIDRIQDGINASTYYGFDPVTRSLIKSGPTNEVGKDISFIEVFGKVRREQENSSVPQITNIDKTTTLGNYKSKVGLGIFHSNRSQSKYIQKYDPSSISKLENYENITLQRKALFANLLQKTVRVVVPGNFNLTSGFSVYLTVPKQGSEIGVDRDLTGKYLISATRHSLYNRVHSTVLELVSDSVEFERPQTNAPLQTDAASATFTV